MSKENISQHAMLAWPEVYGNEAPSVTKYVAHVGKGRGIYTLL